MKTRSIDCIVPPQEAVTTLKQNLIVNAADGYMRHFNRKENARLDVIIVLHENGNVLSIEHMKDAFVPRVRTH